MAIYACRECENEEFIPRRYTFHFGEHARCPQCGTFRLTRLRGRDKIDKMASGVWNTLERMAGGVLYHCCFCRVQFYDRRKTVSRATLQPIVNPREPIR
jgi:DNA-directed RNA polymerase subunit RPC12/RpoP